MSVERGKAVVWGVRDPRPIINIPPDSKGVRLRLRNNSFAVAFVRFADRVERWVLCPADNTVAGIGKEWVLGWRLGINVSRVGCFDPIEPLFRFVPKKKDVVKLYEVATYFDTDGSTIEIPAGVESDLASIPRIWQRVLPKLDLHRMAAILHDYLYQLCGNLPDGRKFTREQCDKKFLEAMTALGVPKWKRQAMYWAVRSAGFVAWNGHAKRIAANEQTNQETTRS